MVHTYTYNGLTWIDVESPVASEISELVHKYNLNPMIGEELLSSNSESHVELHKNCLYLTLDIPSRIKNKDRASASVVKKELDFVIGKDFIITTKYDTIEPLHNFSRVFETNSIIDKNGIGEHAGFIFYYMLKKIYTHIGRDLNNIRDNITQAESKIFAGDEKMMVIEMSHLGREIIDIKQILRSHRETLELTGVAAEKMFGANFRYHTDDLSAEYEKIIANSNNLYELLCELRDTNDSLLSSKQNETMKMLTLMAFVTFPLSLIIGIFSLKTTHVPIVGLPFDFEIILFIMFVFAVIMFGTFRFKKWL